LLIIHQKDIKVLKTFDPEVVGDGEGWLVIDDLVDSGKTIQAVREMLPSAHFAAIYAKPNGEPFIDTYETAVAQDRWIYFPWYLESKPVDPIALTQEKV